MAGVAKLFRAHSTRIRKFSKTEIFFLRFSLPSTCKRRFRAPKMQVFENGQQSGDL